jgi:hypothetical protein
MKFENFNVLYLNIKPEIGNTCDSRDGLHGVANNAAYQQIYVCCLHFIYFLNFLSHLILRFLNHSVNQ